MPLIGTAGHVDHGKSTLVKALTGRDPDRWAEEKRRGLTIDLGFAWATLGDVEVSFVDVPGHERFLKNMLAGIEAIEVALFVVAADEGWMPQSEEHLAVLDLLGVARGVVALTKADTVDRTLIELAAAETREQLQGTSLAGSAVMPVSGTTGEGIEELADHLVTQVHQVDTRDIGRPRLWVDRVFTARGAGTVVTGSLLDGRLDTGMTVEILPSGVRARVRGIQSHEEEKESVGPGRRVAVNLSGLERDAVGRGDMLALPSQWSLTGRVSASLSLARYEDELRRRGAYQIHIGTTSREMRFVAVEDRFAIIDIDQPIPAAVGDRFIVRDTGRGKVVAGGRILDPNPSGARSALAVAHRIDPDADTDKTAQVLLDLRGQDSLSRISADSGGGTPEDAAFAGDSLVSEHFLADLAERAVAAVQEEHARHPLRPGMSIATLAESLAVDQTIADLLVSRDGRLRRDGPYIAIEGFEVALDEAAETAWESARDRLGRGLDVPEILDLDLDPELVHLKVRQEELVRISDDMAYLPEQIEQLREAIRSFGSEFTVAEFRDAVGLSRKYAVPILEWADAEGLTTRRGNLRRVL
ncbi:MAG: selenocysteine-specific translation elongation factor [Acidimicrobiia bacterium]|nr:selenocysteine-specific translation elongation factor [Acidimicrobiia bacterium]